MEAQRSERLESCETIVVDNASADGSAEMVTKEFPSVTLIASAENLGFGGGNNLGYSRCRGEFVLLLNPDTELKAGTLTATMNFLEKNPTAGAVGVRQVETTGNLQESCGHFPSLRTMVVQNALGFVTKYGFEKYVRAFARFFEFPLMPVKHLKPLFDFDAVHEVDWIMGAFMLLRRRAIEQITLVGEQLFDPRFVMFGEEIDLCRRIVEKGWKVFFVPAGEILHHGGASTAKISERAETMRQVGMILYYEKHHGPIDAFIYRLIIGTANLFVWLRAKPDSASKKQARGRIKAACLASYDALPD
jgi:hypothetical protein